MLTISFTIPKKSHKNAKPRHHSNSRISNTKTQHHPHDLTMTSSEPTFHKTKWGDIYMLNHTNYDEWRDDIIPVLSTIRAYATVSREDPEPQLLDLDQDDNFDIWNAKEAEDTSTIRLSCSAEVRRLVNGMRYPHVTWNVQETSLNTPGSYIRRQDILRQFHACRPMEDEPLKSFFIKLSNYRTQLDHTEDAITDRDVNMQIPTSLPSQYVMI